MRYSRVHKEEVRERLVTSSRAIAKSGGFASTGVDALMKSIGLTGGAFYAHFPSKQALLDEIVARETRNSADMLGADEGVSTEDLARLLRGYLSSYHVLHPDEGCFLPTLGSEIARAGPDARKAVERSLVATQRRWQERVGDPDAAWALLAQCVGAIVLARAVNGTKARKDILAACRRFIDAVHDLEHPVATDADRQARAR